MGVLEIVLLLAGCALAVLSFIVPVAHEEVPQETRELAQGEIKTLVAQEMDGIRQHVDDVVDEAVGYAVEKTERSLERLTNEKIMAVNEYSDTVLQEIHKNHEEAMFLYDMLNSKHNNLKNTVSEVNKTVKEVEESRREAEAVVNSLQQIRPEVMVNPALQTQAETAAEGSFQQFRPEVVTPGEGNGKLLGTAVPDTELPMQQIEGPSTGASMDVNFMTGEPDAGVNNNEQILQMHQQGKSTVAIAKELGLGVGEVKLVIDLYRNL